MSKNDQSYLEAFGRAMRALGKGIPASVAEWETVERLARTNVIRPPDAGKAGADASSSKRAARVLIRRDLVREALSRLTKIEQAKPFSEGSLDALEMAYETVRSETIARSPDVASKQYKVGRDTLVKDLKAIRRQAKTTCPKKPAGSG